MMDDQEPICDVEELRKGIGMPLEVCHGEQTPDFDPKCAWKDVANPQQAKVTIGVSVVDGWDHAKKETDFFRDKLEDHFGTSKPKAQQLFDLVLGEESTIYGTFLAQSIFPNFETYSKFLGTFFLSSAHQV